MACARVLRRAGCYVEVFEQGKGIGGRIGTARLGVVPFDHGTQYLTARGDRFRAYLKELEGAGYLERWEPRIFSHSDEEDAEAAAQQSSPWYVGVPGMQSVVRPLAESVRMHFERRVHTIARTDKGWYIWFDDETNAGPFTAVAVAVPAPAASLLLGRLDELAEPLSRVRMTSCWALMVRLDEKTLPDQDAYSDMSQIIRWISRNNSKPGRTLPGEHIVVHASQNWSRETEDLEPEAVAEELWAEVSHILSLPPVRPKQMVAHLWHHGLVDMSLGETYMFSTEHMVGVAGDWCLGRLAEHAYESGNRLGKAIVDALT